MAISNGNVRGAQEWQTSTVCIADCRYLYIMDAELQRHPHDLEPVSSKCLLPGLVTVVTLTEMEN